MCGVNDLRFPGVENAVTPVNDAQAAALRAHGWVDVNEVDDVADIGPQTDTPDDDQPYTEER